jgi:hypothetical protein
LSLGRIRTIGGEPVVISGDAVRLSYRINPNHDDFVADRPDAAQRQATLLQELILPCVSASILRAFHLKPYP